MEYSILIILGGVFLMLSASYRLGKLMGTEIVSHVNEKLEIIESVNFAKGQEAIANLKFLDKKMKEKFDNEKNRHIYLQYRVIRLGEPKQYEVIR